MAFVDFDSPSFSRECRTDPHQELARSCKLVPNISTAIKKTLLTENGEEEKKIPTPKKKIKIMTEKILSVNNLLKIHPAEGRKKTMIVTTNGIKNRIRFRTDATHVKSVVGWGEQNRLRRV